MGSTGRIGALLAAVVVFGALASCEQGEVQSPPDGSPAPEPSAIVDDLSPTPSNPPARALTDSSTPATTPTETVVPIPSGTPVPTLIPPSSTPTATLTLDEAARTHLSQAVPWAQNPPDDTHRQAVDTLVGIYLADVELGDAFAGQTWIIDGLTESEMTSLNALAAVARADSQTAKTVLPLAWIPVTSDTRLFEGLYAIGRLAEVDADLALITAGAAWFANGVDYDDPYGAERSALASFTDIAEHHPQIAAIARGWAWISDDMTGKEAGALRYIARIAKNDAELAGRLAASAWITDGIAAHEAKALNDLALMTDTRLPFAQGLVESFTGDAVSDRDIYMLSALFQMSEADPEQFEALIDQSWFTDGLSPEETAFITALNPAPYGVFESLIETRHTRSATITLPLAGDVNLWAFQPVPFLHDEDLLEALEEAVRGAERLMQAPFPTNDLIVLILGDSASLGGVAGQVGANHVRLARFENRPLVDWLVYHEIGHFYFTGLQIGPPWMLEGGADFVAAYTTAWAGGASLEDQLVTATESKQRNCIRFELTTIHILSSPDLPDPSLTTVCHYVMGRELLISLYLTLGETAMSAALRELYEQSELGGSNPTDEDVYRVFLKHTPAGLETEFRNVYRRLHGGPFIDVAN